MQEEHIAKPKLSNEVFDRLKRMIVDEAMQTLSNVDLIEINHGQRSRVL